VAAFRQDTSSATAFLIVWSEDYRTDAGGYQVAAKWGADNVRATVEKAEVVEVPSAVRTELIYAGHAKPPLKVTWLTVKVDVPEGRKGPLRLNLGYGSAPSGANGTVVVPFDPSS
jgi:hypothetical protein